MTLSWKKVQGADGYCLYYGGKTLKTIKNGKTSYKIKKIGGEKLKNGTTYQFKIAPYKTIDGKKYFGEKYSFSVLFKKPKKTETWKPSCMCKELYKRNQSVRTVLKYHMDKKKCKEIATRHCYERGEIVYRQKGGIYGKAESVKTTSGIEWSLDIPIEEVTAHMKGFVTKETYTYETNAITVQKAGYIALYKRKSWKEYKGKLQGDIYCLHGKLLEEGKVEKAVTVKEPYKPTRKEEEKNPPCLFGWAKNREDLKKTVKNAKNVIFRVNEKK